jgi:predicted DNA-binding transcriptional regulator AlpA
MAGNHKGTQPPSPLLTIDQVADWLQIPKNTLYRQNSQGTPPGSLGVRVGRWLRYDRSHIQEWLDQGGA